MSDYSRQFEADTIEGLAEIKTLLANSVASKSYVYDAIEKKQKECPAVVAIEDSKSFWRGGGGMAGWIQIILMAGTLVAALAIAKGWIA